MNRDVLESQWTQIREILREKFSNLTDEDIRQINGRYDQLVAKLQQKYGYSREEAEDRIRSWNFDRFTNTSKTMPVQEDRYTHKEDRYYQREMRRDEGSNLFKWILALGIPLLLLAAYFFNPARMETTRTPAATNQEQVMTGTTADRTLSTDVRNAFMARGFDLQNVEITTNNGVVTLSGTVPNTETRDSLVNTAEGFTGVRQVVNNLQVR